MLILSATITSNVLKYMQILLKLLALSCISKQLFNRPNLIYKVVPIRKAGFQNLAFIIPSAGAIFNIIKTMIFIDLIDEVSEIVKYLRSRLSKCIKTIK